MVTFKEEIEADYNHMRYLNSCKLVDDIGLDTDDISHNLYAQLQQILNRRVVTSSTPTRATGGMFYGEEETSNGDEDDD